MIVIDDNLLAVWQCQIADDQDFLGGLSRTPDGGFEINYRFRYYRDDLLTMFSKDDKHWYRCTIKPGLPLEVAITPMRALLKTIEAQTGNVGRELIRDNHPTEWFMQEMSKWGNIHASSIPQGGTA